MSNLLEIYDLMEWGEVDASKRFWEKSKENRIDEDSFVRAFKSELEDLDLWKLFDPVTKLLASRGSYGEIKKALETDPNNWTLKALQRLWVLQFKNNAKTNAIVAEEEKKAAEEQKRLEAEKRNAEIQLLHSKETDISNLINKLGTDFVKNHLSELHAKADKINSIADKLHEISRELYYTYPYKVNYAKSEDCLFTTKIKVAETPGFYGYAKPYIFITISLFAGFESGGFMEIQTDALDEATITKNFEKVLTTALNNLTNKLDQSLSKVESVYTTVEDKINLGKKAQADVDAGKPTDPDFSAKILAILTSGYKKASDEYHSWASWEHDDGDSGAAFAIEKSRCLKDVAFYVLGCNWLATKGDEVIASWRSNESVDKLYEELDKLFELAPNFDFELVK